MKLRVLFLLIVALFGAIGVLAQDAKIKAGDKIRLMCEEESALNKDYTVSDDGLVLIDFLGAVKISDLTEKQAAEKISKQLVDERILSKATIRVEIVRGESQYIKFEGAVDTEGDTPYKKDMRLDYILLLAVPTAEADLTRIQIISASGKTTLVDFSKFNKETNANNPLIQPGDKIVVPKKVAGNPGGNPTGPGTNPGGNPGNPGGGEVKPPTVRNGKVKIEGAVFLTGEYDFAEGMTVREAILRAGGYGNNADTGKVVLSRGGTKRELKMPDDANFALMAGDMISIPATESNEFIVSQVR
ncbi:MAG: polysaccharide biosynthesis/export family protein [Fimbriimonadaceae bacterium]